MSTENDGLSAAIKKIWGDELKSQMDSFYTWYSIYGDKKPDTRSRFTKWRHRTRNKFWAKMHDVVEKHGACNNYY